MLAERRSARCWLLVTGRMNVSHLVEEAALAKTTLAEGESHCYENVCDGEGL